MITPQPHSQPVPAGEPPATRIEKSVGVQVGTGNQQTVNYYVREPEPKWPIRLGAVPLAADCYQDRDASVLLTEGRNHTGLVTLAPTATTVVTGMGGVGKTQIVAQYIHPLWEDPAIDLIVWIAAVDRDAIVTGYAQAAYAVGQAADKVPATAARALLNWLSTTDRRWVVVLDDLQDPDDIKGWWPPHVTTGHTLATTRRRDAALQRADRQIIEIPAYTETESLAYLTAKLADHPGLINGAPAMAAELGHLPLALAQAVAYVLDAEISCEMYRQRFRSGHDVAPDRLPDDHQRTVDRTWELSIALADQLKPAGVSRPLLELLSLLDPHGVPATLLTSVAVADYLEERTGSQVTAEDVQRAVRCLHRLSLVSTDSSHPARGVRVHALVQHAARVNVLPSDFTQVTIAAADALAEIWPPIERDSDLAQSLRTNATELERYGGTHLWRDGGHAVLFRHGHSLGQAGLARSACSHFERLHTTAHERFGPDHPRTLAARGSMAYWRGETGDVMGAMAEFEDLRADQLRTLGSDHPEALTARHNLAYLRGLSGDVAAAIAGFEELLADRHRVLGADHPDTLVVRHNLARWRAEAGDAARSLAEYEQLVADQARVMGYDHPDTLITRHNLTHLRSVSGDAAAAIREFERLLDDRTRILGDDHPRTLITHINLVQLRGTSGDASAAVIEFEQLLANVVRVLGPDHPDTLNARRTQAYLRGEAGDEAAALIELESLLIDQVRILGTDGPGTLTTRHMLAHLRGKTGDSVGAVAEYERLLADQARVLGVDHPDTLSTRGNLARWRGTTGDVAGAVVELEKLLVDRLRVLGESHQDTLVTRHNLATLRGQSGDVEGALAEFEQLLTLEQQLRGPDHPDTLGVRHNMAYLRGAGGDVAGAVAEYEHLLADVLRIFGTDHPRVELTKQALAAFTLPASDL